MEKKLGNTLSWLTQQWTAMGFDPIDFSLDDRGTLVSHPEESAVSSDEAFASTGTLLETGSSFSIDQLPYFSFIEKLDSAEVEYALPNMKPVDLCIHSTIGAGGMGVVQQAFQVPLHREVAVKRLRVENRKKDVTMSLLREAWITGLLEHPHIVPVYMLGLDKNDSPMFVMKRIEGVSWEKVMSDPEHPLRKDDARDHFSWNFDVLMKVCNAVEYAHSKGILHRDLKPENVMIGEFGQVYLLDWGIAVCMKEHGTLPLPKASDIKKVEGTPAYMAPEMVSGQGENISERTDIYQLGGILHQIVTGKPRHGGGSVLEVMMSAFYSTPYQYSLEVPVGLAALCHQAMHAEPEQRFEEASCFRKKIADFLKHRDSIIMSEESEVVLNQLEQLVEDVEPQDQQAHMWLYKVYSECRFGFLQALRTWPENEQASVGHDRAILHMIDYEIRCRNDQAATLFIAELRVPAPELQIRLDALIVELESEQQHIKDLKEGVKQYDLSVGSRTRRFIAVVLGLVYSPLLLLFGELWGVLKFNYAWFFASVGLFTVLILFFSVWARESMMKTMINRKILKSLWVLGGAEFLFILGSFLLDVSITDAVILSMMMFTLFCGLSAIFVEKILMLPTIVMLIGFFTAVFFYRYAFDIFAVTQCLSLIALAVCWGSLKGLGRKGSLKSGSV